MNREFKSLINILYKPGGVKLNTICLPLTWTPGKTYEEWGATVAGWGATKNFGKKVIFNNSKRNVKCKNRILILKKVIEIIFLIITASAGSEGLRKLSVPIINIKDCRAALENMGTPILDDANLCAGGQEG